MRLFEDGLPILKGNTHMHTSRSDGALSPAEALAFYQTHGYDFVALTDHWVIGDETAYGRMVVLPGAELDVMLPREAVHIVGIGLTGDLPASLDHHSEPQALIDGIRGAGGRAILCHPAWSLSTAEHTRTLQNLSATEIYNTFSGIPWNAGRADAGAFIDQMLASGWPTRLVAADDAHRYDGEACVSYIRVQAEDRTREGILAGLDRGAYYASQGPEIAQITCEDGVIELTCSPVDYIVFYSASVWVRDRCRHGHGMTHAIYEVQPTDRYVRCELIDRFGRKAWSNPIYTG